MFRWMVFFMLILAGILAFVTWVMGIPIPGLSQFGIQQPTSPFGGPEGGPGPDCPGGVAQTLPMGEGEC